MLYCIRCGVEVDSQAKTCPLCDSPIQILDEMPETVSKQSFPEDVFQGRKTKFSLRQKNRLVLEIVSVILGATSAIVLTLNLSVSSALTWSVYPLAGILLLWLLTFFPLVFWTRPAVIVIGSTVSITFFLMGMDLLDGKFDIFNAYSIPLIGVILVVTVLVSFLSIRSKTKGANTAGFILLGASILCVCIDIIISYYYLKKTSSITWSRFVAAPGIIISILLLYLHYRFKRLKLFDRIRI